jgi:hypothetical protein
MNESNQGGTATQARQTTNGNPTPIDDQTFRRLQEMRRGSISGTNPTASDGYLSIMLVQRAGWTIPQTARFLGLNEAGVQNWNQSFGKGNLLDSLSTLQAPAPAAL